MNRMHDIDGTSSPDATRRRLLRGMAIGGAAAGLGLWGEPVWALATPNQAGVLAGTDFDLRIGATPVDITGRTARAITVNGSLPGPILRWREGDTVTLRVRNTLAETSAIHWHGLLLPANMDGVPGLSFHGIEPGGDYLYRFKVRQHGTYWYHSHSSLQEQAGVYGAIIIDPIERAPFAYDRDYVVLLSDWTDMDPHRLFARLKKRSDYDNLYKRTAGDFLRDVREQGLSNTLADRKAWGAMRMSPTDLADVNGNTYTYLANGRRADDDWTGLFAPGERVRLRFVNGAAMTFFDVRIPGLKLTVVAADGQDIRPVDVDEFRIAPAETFDVIVQPKRDQAYVVFAQAMDRSGHARITLAPRMGMRAPSPALDQRALLTMDDMGHGSHAMAKWPAARTWTIRRCPCRCRHRCRRIRPARPAIPSSTCRRCRRRRAWTIPASACATTAAASCAMRTCAACMRRRTIANLRARSSCT